MAIVLSTHLKSCDFLIMPLSVILNYGDLLSEANVEMLLQDFKKDFYIIVSKVIKM